MNLIKKHLSLFILFSYSFIAFGQEDLTFLKGKELQNKIRVSYIPVKMPSNIFPELKSEMGLGSLKYIVPINSWLYTGAGFHYALTGDQGGLFTLGVELGVSKPLYKNLYLDANIHFGGGGGYRYLVNDGAFINPNIGLQFKKKGYAFGIQYSYLNFYSGHIKSNSVSFFIEIPSVLKFTNYKNAHKKFINNNVSSTSFWKRPAVKNAQQVRFEFLFPTGNSKKDDGTPLTEPLAAIGFEYQKYINPNTFIFAHTDAVYKGLRAGFMDLFLGAGYYPYQSKYINVFGKLAIGAAGGRVAPEGGFMVYPSAGIDIKLNEKLALSGHGGYYRAIAGNLEAYTLGVGLKYMSLNGGTDKGSNSSKHFYTQGLRIEVLNQSIFKVAKTDDVFNAQEIDLQLIGLKANYHLNKWLYIAGEAGFAYAGRSGGYAHGMVGAGVYSKPFLNSKLRGFMECMAGAGGGAGVDTDQGILIRPTLGLTYSATEELAFVIAGGRYYSPFGNVNSNALHIGASFNLATLLIKN